MDRRGASEIITTISLIALVLVLVGIVSLFVLNLVQSNIDETSVCFNVFDKVVINKQFSCFDSVKDELIISVEVRNVDLDSFGLGVYYQGGSKNFMITNNTESPFKDSRLRLYDGRYNMNVSIPEKNSALSYVVNMTGYADVKEIRLTPVIKSINCGVSDSLNDIKDCKIVFPDLA